MTNIPKEIIDKVDALRKFDFSSIERSELGKDFNFKEASKKLQKILNDLEEAIIACEIVELPIDETNHVVAIGNRIDEYIKQIQTFSMDKGSIEELKNKHKQIHDQIETLYQDDLKHLRPILRDANFFRIKPAEVKDQISKAVSASKEIEKIKQEIRDEAANAKKEVTKTIKEVQDALGSGATGISSSAFDTQSTTHGELARNWFIAAIIIIVLSFFSIFVLFKTTWIIPAITSETTLYELIHLSVFKLVVLSLVYVLIYQSIKSYKINKHLQVTNKHRQLSLGVYPLMVKASSDPAHSSLIASEAAKSVFNQGTTGYLDGDDNINPVNLTEIISRVAERK